MPQCRSCGAEVRWRKTPEGKVMPLDVEESAEGNVLLVGADRCQMLTRGQRKDHLSLGTPLYRSHFATCPNAARHSGTGGQSS